MATYRVKGIKELQALIRKNAKKDARKLAQAVRKTARQGAVKIKQHMVPVAHAKLRDSIHADGARIVADAPHAAAVEFGSRPHFPPVDAIEKWVKIRGAQAQLTDKQIRRIPGVNLSAVRAVGAMISAHTEGTHENKGRFSRPVKGGRFSSLETPRQVAYMIARAIAARGTKPQGYMRASMPLVVDLLDKNIRKALGDDLASGAGLGGGD